MSYETNPYYNPEALGLKLETRLDMTKYDYSYDYRVVWSDEAGQIYTAYDSGCSCPTPFEDYTSIDSLDKVPQDVTWDELRKEADAFGQPSSDDLYWGDRAPDHNSIKDYLKVLDTLEGGPEATGTVKVELSFNREVLDSFVRQVADEVRQSAQELIDFADGLEEGLSEFDSDEKGQL